MLRNSKGAVSLIIAMMLFVIVGILAATVDLSRMQSTSIDNQSGTDAAALATAEYILQAKISKIGQTGYEGEAWKNYLPAASDIRNFAFSQYNSNSGADQTSSIYDRNPNSNTKFTTNFDTATNTLTVNACSTVTPLQLSKSVGFSNNKEICTTSKAGFNFSDSSVSNLEIAFAMDINLLNNGRVQATTSAVSSLSDKLLNNGQNKVFFSVVPFDKDIMLTNYENDLLSFDTSKYNVVRNSTIDSTYNYPVPAISASRLQSTTGGYDGNSFEKFKTLQEARTTNPLYISANTFDIAGSVFHAPTGHSTLVPERRKLYIKWSRPEMAVQPLTSDGRVIKSLMTALPNAMTRMYSDACNSVVGYNVGQDNQYVHFENVKCASGGIPNALPSRQFRLGTPRSTGVSGLFGAWLTVAPGWQGKWNKPSFLETNPIVPVLNPAYASWFQYMGGYPLTPVQDQNTANSSGLYAADTSSAKIINGAFNVENRAQLPSAGANSNKKAIILFSGFTNTLNEDIHYKELAPYDGSLSDPSSYLVYPASPYANRQDTYNAIPALTSGMYDMVYPETTTILQNYTNLCKKIKDSGVEIYFINIGNLTPDFQTACTDASHIFSNVGNGQVSDKLSSIFATQSAKLTPVKLITQ